MTQFAAYTGTPNDPTYLGLSKTPEAIKPNIAMGKLFEGIGDVVEMGIKGIDEIQKESLKKEAESSFSAANQNEIARLEAIHGKITGGADPAGAVGTPLPTSFAEPDSDRGPIGPFGRDGKVENAPIRDDTPLPPQAQAQLTYLSKIQQAGINGKLTATGVQMNGESIMSDLLQRYPSRTEQIRAIASKYGYGEGKYAAQLRTEINQWQQLTQAKEGKDETWENANRDILMGTKDAPGVDPAYFQKPKEVRRSPEYRDQLQSRIGNYEAIKKNNDTEESSIKIRAARREEITGDQARVWTSRINLEEGVGFRNLMDSMGFTGVNNVQDFLQKWRSDPRNQDPAALQEINSKLQEYKIAKMAKWTNDAANTYVGPTDDNGRPLDPKTPTVLQLLKRDGLDKLHGESLGHIDAIQKMVDSKGAAASADWAGAAGRENQGSLDTRTREVYKKYPVIRDTKVLENALGPQVFGQMYQINGSVIRKPLDDAAVAVIDGTTSAIARGDKDTKTGKPITINDTLHDYSHLWGLNGKGNAPKPQDLSGLMDRVKTNLMNPNLPPDLSVKFANYVFTDNRLFPQLVGENKQKFLTQYASPEVSARIFSLGDAALNENYKRWVYNAVSSTTQETVANFNAVIQRGEGTGTTGTAFSVDKYSNFVFDPKTNRITGTTTSNQDLYNELGTTPTRYASIKNQLDTLRNSVNKINQSLAIVDPVLKQEKTTISPEMTALVQSMGIKVKIGEEKNEDGTSKPIFQPQNKSVPVPKPRPNAFAPEAMPNSGVLNYDVENAPSSGNVGTVEDWMANPAGQVTPRLKAQGKGGKRSTNLTDSQMDIQNMKVDDIPEGMSARDFIKQLQSRP